MYGVPMRIRDFSGAHNLKYHEWITVRLSLSVDLILHQRCGVRSNCYVMMPQNREYSVEGGITSLQNGRPVVFSSRTYTYSPLAVTDAH